MANDVDAPVAGGRSMTPSGAGFLLPPKPSPAVSPLDARMLRHLVGAFEPGYGYAVVHQGQLCYNQHGQAHIYAIQYQAMDVLRAVGNPPGYDVVQVLTADRSRCARTLV